MTQNLKMAAMMQGHSKSNKQSVYLYHGPLTIFDNQICFDMVFKNPMDSYKRAVNHGQGGTVFERDNDNNRM